MSLKAQMEYAAQSLNDGGVMADRFLLPDWTALVMPEGGSVLPV
jgi:hypothetical protein